MMGGTMGSNPVQPPIPSEQQLDLSRLQNELQVAKSHYCELLQYFKHLVWLTGGAVALVVAVAGVLLYSNMRDVRQDAREQATHVATAEAERGVKQAFDEKNVNELVQKVAREKINAVTDNMIEQKVSPIVDRVIEQQLSSKLQPIQQRILLIGRISECEARIHLAYRSALEELTTIMNETHDADARQFAHSTLITTSQGYDTFWQPVVDQQTNMSPFDKVRLQVEKPGLPQVEVVKDLGGVVRVINKNQDLNAVAIATIVFRGLTGNKDLKMFDFKAVNAWCASHEPQCK
jgi:hypothetical protein